MRVEWLRAQLSASIRWQRRDRERVVADIKIARQRREQFQREVSRRNTQKEENDATRRALLAELDALSPVERIRRVATDRSIDLSWVPVALVPVDLIAAGAVEPEVTAALLARIGVRRGPWREVAGEIRRLG